MTLLSFMFCSLSDWKINTSPVRVLGDDVSGPHSTAIIIGRKTVVACAHSLDLVVDESGRSTRSNRRFKYLEDYWIQPHFTKNTRGEWTSDNRIPIKLYKFHAENDWALFTRCDGGLFLESEVATIDMTPREHPDIVLCHKEAIVYHCPVSMKIGMTKVGELSVGCQRAAVHIQTESTHHVKYEGSSLCRGSSGGGVYVKPSTSVLGIHLEAINDDVIIPEKKKLKVDSETVASLAAGNNGLGSALILCKFPRLMHYLGVLEE